MLPERECAAEVGADAAGDDRADTTLAAFSPEVVLEEFHSFVADGVRLLGADVTSTFSDDAEELISTYSLNIC